MMLPCCTTPALTVVRINTIINRHNHLSRNNHLRDSIKPLYSREIQVIGDQIPGGITDMKVLSRPLGIISMVSIIGTSFAQDLKKAPDFSAKDENGKAHSLADLKGKIVVLEFTNPGSPV